LTESEATEENDQYQEAVKWLQTKSRDEGIDACLKRHSLDLVVAPWSGVLILPLFVGSNTDRQHSSSVLHIWHCRVSNADSYVTSDERFFLKKLIISS
jgi:hypothetical protein